MLLAQVAGISSVDGIAQAQSLGGAYTQSCFEASGERATNQRGNRDPTTQGGTG